MWEQLPEFDLNRIAEIDKDPLKRESDRGCVLILASDVENRLAQMLKDMFQKSNQLSRREKKNIFDYTGPLGTFSSKIYLAKAIGLIDSILHDDIQKIRSIRNMAAHSDESFSLSNDDVKQTIASMHFDHNKTGRLPIYSLQSEEDESESDPTMSETIMKGYGLLRVDKINFILTVREIQLELSMFHNLSASMGDLIRDFRENEISKIREFIDEKRAEFAQRRSEKTNDTKSKDD